MDTKDLLKQILKIGKEMLRSGAEVGRVEDSLYRMCRGYGFISCEIWVISSNIQAMVETESGELITEISYIRDTAIDFDTLDLLNTLSRYICANKPAVEEIERRLEAILCRPAPSAWKEYTAGVLAASGFGVFFNCDWLDAIVAAVAAVLLTWLGRRLRKQETNPLIYNFILSFLVEIFIIFCVHLGFGHHAEYITIGNVMLLISALGTTNGIRDLLHRDTLSGALNIANSFIGAAGIALGIALAMLAMKGIV